jgi:hypothetical protein
MGRMEYQEAGIGLVGGVNVLFLQHCIVACQSVAVLVYFTRWTDVVDINTRL